MTTIWSEDIAHVVGALDNIAQAIERTVGDSLGDAWDDTVLALPEGYTLTLTARPNGWCEATATGEDGKHEITDAEHIDGPIATLRALPAKLRER